MLPWTSIIFWQSQLERVRLILALYATKTYVTTLMMRLHWWLPSHHRVNYYKLLCPFNYKIMSARERDSSYSRTVPIAASSSSSSHSVNSGRPSTTSMTIIAYYRMTVIFNNRLYSTFCAIEANYWQTRSIVGLRPF